MTAPGGGGADEIREQLAAALREAAQQAFDTPCEYGAENIEDCPTHGHRLSPFAWEDGRITDLFGEPEAFADALLLTVGRLAAAQTAEELRTLAKEMPGVNPYVLATLRDRAAALDGTP